MILLSVCITATGQSLKPINKDSAALPKDELKFVINIFVDYMALKELRMTDMEKIAIQARIIDDKDKLLEIKNEDIDRLKQQIEDISPSWWNKFSYGLIIGIIGMTLVILGIGK